MDFATPVQNRIGLLVFLSITKGFRRKVVISGLRPVLV